MSNSYKIAYQGGIGEIVEKKSRFIANVFPVKKEEEALEFLEKIRKEHWNATHNCFAYTIGEKHQIQRCSDDGEPSGTAGRPILDVLLGEEIHNVIVVVTRYFGGTLLGTGGLVRAYSKATQEGLKESIIIEKFTGKEISVVTDYNGIGKIQYIIGQMELTVEEIQYTDIVTLFVLVPLEKAETFEKKVIEATAGKVEITYISKVYYGIIEKEVIILE